jgi:hypothetical protein
MDERTIELVAALKKLAQAQELLEGIELDTPNETTACYDAIEFAQSMIIEALECSGVRFREYSQLLVLV